MGQSHRVKPAKPITQLPPNHRVIPPGKVLYTLKLEHDKYYVGVSTNFNSRLKQHKNGIGAEWTKHYHFVSVLNTKLVNHDLDEDNEVKKLMMEHGIDNVRGGSYSNIKLTKDQLTTLEHEFSHASGKCFRCGSTDHYVVNCNKEIKKPRNNTQFCISCGREHNCRLCTYTSNRYGKRIGIVFCERCGRSGHAVENCYAKSTHNGVVI